jgi:hypothetical protein
MTLSSSHSTSRPVTSAARGCPSSAPTTSPPCPAQALTKRIGPTGISTTARRMRAWTTANRRESRVRIVVVEMPLPPMTEPIWIGHPCTMLPDIERCQLTVAADR